MSEPTAAEAASELSEFDRRAVETLLVSIADDEFVLAERYTEWQVRAPSLESDLALSNIAQDELGHARLWYDVLEDFGYAERDLLYERDPDDFRHASLAELPFETGDWADAIVRSYLYDVAESLRLEALRGSSYPPIARRVPKIVEEEAYHRQHAEAWLDRLAESPRGLERLQTALDRLFPHALALFQPAVPPTLGRHEDSPDPLEVESHIVERGFRTETLDDLGAAWLETVTATLEGYELAIPIEGEAVTADALPEPTGRDGRHGEDWAALYDEFTRTYRTLGRTDTTRIMPEPDDG